MADQQGGARTAAEVGLCFGCRHARIVDSRTSRFWRCGLSDRDPRFPRYPRLPVLACDGHQPGHPEPGNAPAQDRG